MNLYEYLNQFHAINRADFDLLTANLQPKVFEKGDCITVPAQIHNALLFVKSGIKMSIL